jgi:hypothetical protein
VGEGKERWKKGYGEFKTGRRGRELRGWGGREGGREGESVSESSQCTYIPLTKYEPSMLANTPSKEHACKCILWQLLSITSDCIGGFFIQ